MCEGYVRGFENYFYVEMRLYVHGKYYSSSWMRMPTPDNPKKAQEMGEDHQRRLKISEDER